jgi:prepilin-type N-terminal cleavage/methylation domain-containing protein
MHKTKGFTLIELLIVVAIIAILAAIAVPNFLEAQVRAKVARAKSDQRSMATAIESYFVDHGTYPVNSNGPAGNSALNANNFRMLVPLSTPIAYISNALLPDPFPSRYAPEGSGGDIYGYVSAIDTTAEAVIYDILRDGDLSSGDASVFGAAAQAAAASMGAPDPVGALNPSEADQLFSLGWAVGSQGPDRVNRRNEIVIAAGGDPSSPGLTLGAASFVIELKEWAQTAPVIYDPTNGTISNGDIIRTGKGIFEPRIVGL